ncbi:MAG: C39 family peptidase [Candidatus Paceibacterota bacterium]|jgi:hypothetical protein
MKSPLIFYSFIIILFGLAFGISYAKSNKKVALPVPTVNTTAKPVTTEPVGKLKSKMTLQVAFMSEAPDGNWTNPWSNACEETVTLMADKYYAGKKSIGISEAKEYLINLFDKEEELFGTNRNSDSKQMLEIISKYANFKGEIKINPTADEIKKEIAAGRPVISLHRGFDLKNPNIEFSPTRSSYHTIIVVGYDDEKQAFITHDPGDEKDGEYLAYGYDLFMDSLHDYNVEDDKTDGPATVIFTSAK